MLLPLDTKKYISKHELVFKSESDIRNQSIWPTSNKSIYTPTVYIRDLKDHRSGKQYYNNCTQKCANS